MNGLMALKVRQSFPETGIGPWTALPRPVSWDEVCWAGWQTWTLPARKLSREPHKHQSPAQLGDLILPLLLLRTRNRSKFCKMRKTHVLWHNAILAESITKELLGTCSFVIVLGVAITIIVSPKYDLSNVAANVVSLFARKQAKKREFAL